MASVDSQPKVAVVLSSTRPARICPDIASWALEHLADVSALSYEPVDLALIDLPLLDEPLMGSLEQYEHEHTKKWSDLVNSFDGFFFVSPQYNWGYPAALKNALDYLYYEWREKPASMLTYGTRGGNKCADQLTQVLHGLHMNVLDARVEAAISKEAVDADWQLIDPAQALAPALPQLLEVDAQFTAALTSDE